MPTIVAKDVEELVPKYQKREMSSSRRLGQDCRYFSKATLSWTRIHYWRYSGGTVKIVGRQRRGQFQQGPVGDSGEHDVQHAFCERRSHVEHHGGSDGRSLRRMGSHRIHQQQRKRASLGVPLGGVGGGPALGGATSNAYSCVRPFQAYEDRLDQPVVIEFDVLHRSDGAVRCSLGHVNVAGKPDPSANGDLPKLMEIGVVRPFEHVLGGRTFPAHVHADVDDLFLVKLVNEDGLVYVVHILEVRANVEMMSVQVLVQLPFSQKAIAQVSHYFVFRRWSLTQKRQKAHESGIGGVPDGRLQTMAGDVPLFPIVRLGQMTRIAHSFERFVVVTGRGFTAAGRAHRRELREISNEDDRLAFFPQASGDDLHVNGNVSS